MSPLRRAYARFGPRYLRVVLIPGFFAGAYLTALGGVSATALYFDMSLGVYLRLLLGAFLLIWTPDAVVSSRLMGQKTEPIVDWLDRGRPADGARQAWSAAARLPIALLRQRGLYITVALTALAWDFYAASELGFSAYSALLIFPGSFLVYAYWVALRFFGTEWVLRPVLEDAARSLPDGDEPEAPEIPLRWRLTAALPAISVITGAVVGGLGSDKGSGVSSLVVGMLAAVIASFTASIWLIALLSESIVTPIRQLREATRRVGAGDLTARVPVVSTDETGELARSFNQMAVGLEERERIRETLGTYVDRDVAEHILREGTSLAGEEVEVTMMFIDVRDFTGFAEHASAAEVVATINRLFERAVPIIHDHQGHVDKFVGDGLLAVFGAPRRQSDHADQALAAALEIEAAVHDEFAGELQIGIGLNSGTVVAGNVGGAGRLEFSVIGDAVNVAARVEAATRQTGDVILVSEHTRRLLVGGGAELDERPKVPLKGKTRAVALYAPAETDRQTVPEAR